MLLVMVYLGMGPGVCKISRLLDAVFILFQFWVGPISVVPVKQTTFNVWQTTGATPLDEPLAAKAGVYK